VRAAPLAVRFALELCALAALAYAGFQAGGAVGWLLAVALPVAAAALWGAFVAPKRAVDASAPVRLLVEALVLGGAAVALALADRVVLGVALAVVALADRVLIAVLRA
jgi:hypothetical protein